MNPATNNEMKITSEPFYPPDPTAGYLSFLLPGLGQVYQGWYGRGVALFIAFIVICSLREGQVFLPLAAFLAGFEAYRPKAKKEIWTVWDEAIVSFWSRWFTDRSKPNRIRRPMYILVGVVGFIGWFFLFAPSLYPFEAQAKLNESADLWSDRVRDYRASRGELPKDLRSLIKVGESEAIVQDPWGRDLLIRQTESGFELRSLGRDGMAETRDDRTYSFR